MNKVMLAMGLLMASTVMVPASAAETEVPLIPADVCAELGVEQCESIMEIVSELIATETTYYVEFGNYASWVLDCTYNSLTNISLVVTEYLNYVEVGVLDSRGDKVPIWWQGYYTVLPSTHSGNNC